MEEAALPPAKRQALNPDSPQGGRVIPWVDQEAETQQ